MISVETELPLARTPHTTCTWIVQVPGGVCPGWASRQRGEIFGADDIVYPTHVDPQHHAEHRTAAFVRWSGSAGSAAVAC